MRTQAIFLAIVSLALSSCSGPLQSQERPKFKWSTSYWYWGRELSEAKPSSIVPDEIFARAGSIDRPLPFEKDQSWRVFAFLPESLPPASAYWLVFRCEEQQVPDLRAANLLAANATRLLALGSRRNLKIAGIQLDVDSPTASLPQYANFLRELRAGLPPGTELSITGLLDWFRKGTAIADVIQQTDGFVPQFYDNGGPDGRESGIASRIDPAHWAPILNRFGKPYRIGISTFGRARLVSPVRTGPFYSGLTPVDIGANPSFRLETSRSNAGELVLTYWPTRNVTIGYQSFQPNQAVQFSMATPGTISTAVANAKRMRGNCAGVVFFRWPSPEETLVMQPEEVFSAAGVTPTTAKPPPSVDVLNGGCALVHCADLFLRDPPLFDPQPLRYRVQASEPLEYFIPQKNFPIRLAGSATLDLTLPAYCGRARMYLGRAVSLNPVKFTLTEEK